jgi:hypothetical protein
MNTGKKFGRRATALIGLTILGTVRDLLAERVDCSLFQHESMAIYIHNKPTSAGNVNSRDSAVCSYETKLFKRSIKERCIKIDDLCSIFHPRRAQRSLAFPFNAVAEKIKQGETTRFLV